MHGKCQTNNLLSHQAVLPPVTANSVSQSWKKTLRRRNPNFYSLPKCDDTCKGFFDSHVTEETWQLALIFWASSKLSVPQFFFMKQTLKYS